MLNNFFLFFLLLFTTSAFSQLEEFKWKKAELSYEKQNHFRNREYSFDTDNAGEFIKKSLANTYWFFISDVDGDNCPFRPSCSSFLFESTEESGIFQASLMFFDRFTRDMNLIKGANHYPRVKSGHYYDPPLNYILNQRKIIYLPPAIIINN